MAGTAFQAAAWIAFAEPLITCVAAGHEDAVASESSEPDEHPAPAGSPLGEVVDLGRNRVEA